MTNILFDSLVIASTKGSPAMGVAGLVAFFLLIWTFILAAYFYAKLALLGLLLALAGAFFPAHTVPLPRGRETGVVRGSVTRSSRSAFASWTMSIRGLMVIGGIVFAILCIWLQREPIKQESKKLTVMYGISDEVYDPNKDKPPVIVD